MKDKEMKRLVIIVWAVLALFVLSLLCGCSHKVYVPVESVRERTDTVYQARLRIDSVTLRDSVVILQRGDTVEITKIRDRYKVRNRVDTVYRSAIDSVTLRVPYPVERKLTKWEQAKMDLGGIAIGGIAIAVCMAVVWLARKYRK